MKLIRQLLIILGFLVAGELISNAFNVSVPGNIIAMLLLLGALLSGKLKVLHIEEVTNFLLDHMALIYVPAGVGILTVIYYIKSVWLWLVLIAVVSTIVVMVATALIVSALRKVRGEAQ